LRRVSSRVDEHLEKLRLQHRPNDMAENFVIRPKMSGQTLI
jgi:hypothetical protein